MALDKKLFKNIVGKGENAGNTMFSTLAKTKIIIFKYLYFVVCKCFEFGPV